ncbi:copper chaperone PCu(A)C [Mangrovimicrobium sediminis]|uniref:copper chaperone PCu(A)C n=1 Tax=Mangrovimicrobium sediminis TaxID=2562682 RepID=UPI001436BAD6|nr:copper chaperone PCu(A)C [Haliea sp. SAOS-164]
MLRRLSLLSVSLFAVSLYAAEPAVTLSGAWVRALPPTQAVTAAYVEIHNAGEQAVTVEGASVAGAGRVEMHETLTEAGLTRMQQLTTLTVAPGETRALQPGGAHLMLFELERMPREGESLRLCIEVAGGETVCADALVRKAAPGNDEMDHSHHH